MVNHLGLHLALQGADLLLLGRQCPAVWPLFGEEGDKFEFLNLYPPALVINKGVKVIADGFEFFKLGAAEAQFLIQGALVTLLSRGG